ncbi:MAG TPA: hypothetical protein VF490_21500 [Chryseosolibacter sp.]
MKKRILVVSKTFYPINSPRSFRATELVREFSRQGHDVTVLTVRNDGVHDTFEKNYGVKILPLGRLRFGSFDISNGGRVVTLVKRIVNRVLNLLFEYPDIQLMFMVRNALKREGGYDLLISIAVPHPVHWGTAWAVASNAAIAKTWVADCGDPYMGEKTDSFRKLFYFKYFEKWFCRKADFVAITNLNMKDNYYPEFHHKIVEITQGFNFEETTGRLPTYKPNGKPTFAYAGTFIPGARDPSAFLTFLVESDFDFRFLIYTPQRHIVQPFVERGKGRIEIMDLVPRTELLKILRTMDFLVNISFDVKVQSPSKLIDYYLVGRPVLSLQSNEVSSKVITKFLHGDYTDHFVFHDYEKFRIEHVCSQFLELGKDVKPFQKSIAEWYEPQRAY